MLSIYISIEAFSAPALWYNGTSSTSLLNSATQCKWCCIVGLSNDVEVDAFQEVNCEVLESQTDRYKSMLSKSCKHN